MKTHWHHGYKGELVLGENTNISESVSIDLTGSVEIGDYTTITDDVKIFTHRHYYNHSRGLRKEIQEIEPIDLHIGRDVFIGQNAIINSIEYIGDGAIIGAGSVLTKNVVDYEVWVGNPAKRINKRALSEEEIKREKYPPVSVCCITYNRVSFLPGIVDMFLKQDYPGEKELVIVNDDPDVELVCKNADVNIYNLPKRYKNIREKVNKRMELCKNEVLIPWADDDLFKPWAISTIVSKLGPDDFVAPVGFYKHSNRGNVLHGQTIAGMYAIRKRGWKMIGGAPVWNEKFARQGIKKRASDIDLWQRVIDAGFYKEANLNKDEVYFTWRPKLADHSMWRGGQDPKKYEEDPNRIPRVVDITV